MASEANSACEYRGKTRDMKIRAAKYVSYRFFYVSIRREEWQMGLTNPQFAVAFLAEVSRMGEKGERFIFTGLKIWFLFAFPDFFSRRVPLNNKRLNRLECLSIYEKSMSIY